MNGEAENELLYRKQRQVCCEDATIWLKSSQELFSGSVFCGIPDIADIYNFIPSSELIQRGNDYREWFLQTIRLIFQRISSGQCIIFSQTDGKILDHDGNVVQWLDKSYLCTMVAEEYNCQLLWHKIAIDQTNVTKSSPHRPSYTHLLCFGKDFRYHTSQFLTPDVIDRGVMTWEKATGLEACILCIAFLRYIVKTSCIINPFCGHGTILAVADYFGIPSIGIEIMPKRARKAQCKDVRSRINLIPRETLMLLLGKEIYRQFENKSLETNPLKIEPLLHNEDDGDGDNGDGNGDKEDEDDDEPKERSSGRISQDDEKDDKEDEVEEGGHS